MSKKTKEPAEDLPLENKSSRRTLLKRALMVLGAGAIVQVSGGVLRMHAEDAHKKQSTKVVDKTSPTVKSENKSQKWSEANKGTIKANKTTNKTIKLETPKKEGL